MSHGTQGRAAPVHLLCNAHVDPVWLWEWEEGAAEAISTFRTAADCCDEFPGYSAHPIGERDRVPQDRFTERIDQGERQFRFWFNGGAAGGRLAAIDREALAHNETPPALCFFPPGHGRQPRPFVTLNPFEIRTYRVDVRRKTWIMTDLLEKENTAGS